MRTNRKNELNVDFIGGQSPLTKEEEKAVNEYINKQKTKSRKSSSTRRKHTTKPQKAVV